MAASPLQQPPRALPVLVLALALSSLVLLVAVEANTPGRVPSEGPIEKRQGSITIGNQLDVALDVQCDSGFKHKNVRTIPVGAGDGFDFAIIDQDYWKCSMSAPAMMGLPGLSGTFVLWARAKLFNPGDDVYWLVNRQGLYVVPNLNRGMTPNEGQLIYHWQ